MPFKISYLKKIYKIMKWINLKEKKPSSECGEFIITHTDIDGVKTSGGAWWNGSEFEDWEDNIIEGVEWWMAYPDPMLWNG